MDLFEQATSLLKTSKTNWFFLEYRPWNRKPERRYRVCYTNRNYTKRYPENTGSLLIETFGSTPDEALTNFISTWKEVNARDIR